MTPNQIKRQIAGRLFRKVIDKHFSSYSDFAETVGTGRSSVSNWMSGRVSIPMRIIVKLGEMFPDELPVLKKIKPEMF
jgi:DNA-binding transcriptional regulator YiaG